MKTYLKIKLNHLAAEARINKKEKHKWMRKAAIGRQRAWEKEMENPTKATMADLIHNHRMIAIRPEARDSNLAYGFLRGRSYAQIEAKRFTDPNWSNIKANIKRFHAPQYGSTSGIDKRFEEWKAAAPAISSR
ncbi:hypothetical protein [Polynucleobacter sp.]|uniref:hypothetical protein n=1 Tax=Polynucleobacter sp. TaxID=2029855 RepID=UPI003F69D0D6